MSFEQRIADLEHFCQKLKHAVSLFLKDEDVNLEALMEEEYSSKSEEEQDEIVWLSPEPMNSTIAAAVAEPVITLVFPKLLEWLTEGSQRNKFARWLKLIDQRNVRQLLFDRDRKATLKYGRGLSEEDQAELDDAIQKLADAVFFIFALKDQAAQMRTDNPNEYARKLNMVTDLHNMIGVFLIELKQAGLQPATQRIHTSLSDSK